MKHLECKEILDDYWRKEIITISQQKNRFPNLFMIPKIINFANMEIKRKSMIRTVVKG